MQAKKKQDVIDIELKKVILNARLLTNASTLLSRKVKNNGKDKCNESSVILKISRHDINYLLGVT